MEQEEIHAINILVCDCPGMILEESLPVLRSAGYSTTYVQNPSDTKTLTDDFDIALISGEVAGGTQGEMFKAVKSCLPHTPLIVAARVRSLASAIDFFREGASDYLAMPLDDSEVVTRIEETIAKDAQTGDHQDQDPEEVEAIIASPLEHEGGLDIERIPNGIIILDGNNNVSTANYSAISMLGHDSYESLVATFKNIGNYEPLCVNEKPLTPAQWPATRASKQKHACATPLNLKRADNNRVWLRVEALPEIKKGKVISVIITLTNITDERAEISRLNEKIETILRANKESE